MYRRTRLVCVFVALLHASTRAQEDEDIGKTRNHRTYIGPGADGSSDDKIAVELRYRSQDNKLTFDTPWRDYVKTTFVQFRGEDWRCKEVDVPIGQVNDMSDSVQN